MTELISIEISSIKQSDDKRLSQDDQIFSRFTAPFEILFMYVQRDVGSQESQEPPGSMNPIYDRTTTIANTSTFNVDSRECVNSPRSKSLDAHQRALGIHR